MEIWNGEEFNELDVDQIKNRWDAVILLVSGGDDEEAIQIIQKMYWELHQFLDMDIRPIEPEVDEPDIEEPGRIMNAVEDTADYLNNQGRTMPYLFKLPEPDPDKDVNPMATFAKKDKYISEFLRDDKDQK